MNRFFKREEKRSRILKAAANVFSREGYHSAKMEDIAITAGTGKGTIYEYFDSKRHLFLSMIEEGTDFFIETLFKNVQEEKYQRNVFKNIIEVSFEFMEQHKDITRLIISHPGMVDEDMQRMLSKKKSDIIGFISKVIEQHVKNNGLKEVNPLIAAHVFFGMMVSLLGDFLIHGRKFEVPGMVEDAADMFYYGIGGSQVQVAN